jgi:uncharacterized protein (DUF58 family)
VTALGWAVLIGSAVAWLVGRRLGWAELSSVAVTGLLAFVLCGLFVLGRISLRVDVRVGDQRAVAGDTAACTVTVSNGSRKPMLPATLELPVDGSPDSPPFHLPALGPEATWEESFGIAAPRRGVIGIGPATTVRDDPLGLLRRTVAWTGVTELIVHPVTVRLASPSDGLLHDLDGRSGGDASPSDFAFHTLRDYVPGDDRRHIHWRSSAKAGSLVPGGKFMVRQFLETRRTHLLVVVDGNAGAYREPDDFETAVSAGASVAMCGLREEVGVTMLTSNQSAHNPVGSRLLDSCARAEPGEIPLAKLVERGMRIAPQATVVLIVTGAAPTFADLRRIRAQVPQGPRILVLQVDPDTPTRVETEQPITVLRLNRLGELRGLLAALLKERAVQ